MEPIVGSLRDPKVRLRNICDQLNAVKGTERGSEFPALIERWQRAPSLKAMLTSDRSLWNEVMTAWAPTFMPSDAGKGAYFETELLVPKNPNPLTAHGFAVRAFAYLVLNPLCEKLGGPCARCGQYYVKKRASQKVYCSARCGNAATAAKRMGEKWVDQHQRKLQRAQQAARRWQRTKTTEPWKEWIEGHCPDISRKFLTRAVNSGQLSEPPAKKREDRSTHKPARSKIRS